MPAKANLTIYQGDDFVADVMVTESDGITPADLTGYTAQSQIRTGYDDGSLDAVAQFATVITDNVITLQLTHDTTALLGSQSYVWDLQVINSAGWVTTILYGQVMVTKEVTKIPAGTVLTKSRAA